MRLIAAAVLVAALPMAACESSSPAPSASMTTNPAVTPETPIPGPSVPAASVPGVTVPGTTAAATDTPPPGAPACASGDLTLSLENASAAAGSIYAPIDFTNTSGSTCTLFGYPGVSLAAGSPPESIGPGAERNSGNPQPVLLGPGAVAHATLRYAQAGNYDCQRTPAEYLLVYPPNQTVAVTLPFAVNACVQPPIPLLHIEYVKPGKAN